MDERWPDFALVCFDRLRTAELESYIAEAARSGFVPDPVPTTNAARREFLSSAKREFRNRAEAVAREQRGQRRRSGGARRPVGADLCEITAAEANAWLRRLPPLEPGSEF